ncbi:hypothetical protein ACIBI9_59130 [Nonomuraea sp. NPDC050451]|uniref:hypothetical protein n=1 Tax=Nonomuraea sp. NPDC050451 TaxID=3364364 RepID=UPI00379ACD3B
MDRTVFTLPPETAGPLREHLLSAYTTIEQVAEPAGAKNLELKPRVWRQLARRGTPAASSSASTCGR